MNNTDSYTQKATLISYLTLTASLFFAVYAIYYFWQADYFFGYLYCAFLASVIASLVVFRRTGNEALALNFLACLGLPVLLTWQATGGFGGTGVFWYYPYIIWLFFILGRSRALTWTLVIFFLSVGEFVLQRLGYLPAPYSLVTMLNFYFGFILESAVLFLSQSAKEKADRLLAEEKTKLQSILDNMAEGIVVSDSDGKYIFFNKAAENIVGISLRQQNLAEWQKTFSVLRPDKVTAVPMDTYPLTKALKGHVSRVEQYIKNNKLKKDTYLLVSESPLRNDQGKITGGIAILSDISVLKETEEKLFNEKAQAEAVLSSIGDGVLAVDTAGRIIHFNRASETISGISARDALNKPYKEVLAFYNKKGVPDSSFIDSALAGKRTEMAANTVLKRKDGTTLPVSDSAAPIVNAQGKLEGAVIVFRDTTREKQLENMKDEFLSVASHELRTPMGAVRANLSMILGGDYGPVNKSLVEPLKDMRTSTARLVKLANDILSLTRIEAGRMQLSVSDFDIQDVLRSVVSTLEPLGKEKGLKLSLTPPSVLLKVHADAEKIKQVLINLIGNSLKFTEHGSITVATKPQKGMVEVTISDTGIGIAKADQKKLFSKFQQITSAQSGKPVGTGLGLHVSREIVRKMGGELWIESSTPGKGTVLAFTVPSAKIKKSKATKKRRLHE